MILSTFTFGFFLVTAPEVRSLSDNSDLGDLDTYKIVWRGPLTTTETLDGDNVIDISTRTKERYKCVIPDNVKQLNFDTSARNSSSDELSESPIKLLEPLFKSDYCSHKFELFWVYELCHGRFLRQYHEENSKFKSRITQEYYLGRIDAEQIKAHEEEYQKQKSELERKGLSRPTILVNGQPKPYVMINMTHGTECDQTKKNRVSRVIYVCSDDLKLELYSIIETSTCEYESIVLAPLLCQHKDFRVNTNRPQEINCYSIGGSPIRPTKLTKSIEADEEEEVKTGSKKRGTIVYFHGKTLIIEADNLIQP